MILSAQETSVGVNTEQDQPHCSLACLENMAHVVEDLFVHTLLGLGTYNNK